MRVPKGISPKGLYYGIANFGENRPLRGQGLNRKTYREARAAQYWILDEVVKEMDRNIKLLKRRKHKRG